MVKKFHIALFIIVVAIYTGNSYAQTTFLTNRNYHINVKQFAEFISRFNYKTDFLGNPVDSSFKSKISRQEYIKLLFNKEDQRIADNDTAYLNLINEFISDVGKNNLKINKYSEKIIAETKSEVIYQNKPREIHIYLNQEIENRGVKWVILSVKTDFLDVLKEDTVLLRFIPPKSNETNFISLKRVFDDKGFQHYYCYDGYKYDALSSFLYALNIGLIKYNYTKEIIYHIYDLNGWQLRVKEFNRNTDNSGWLIDNIEKSNTDLNYLEKIKHCYY